MTIRDLKKYTESLWDWGFLDGCFKRNIKVTDIDGLVEAGGRFLLLEAKSSNAPIPDGQRFAFEALVKTGLWTVLVMWGKPNEPESYLLMDGRPGRPEIKSCDRTEIQFIVSTWFEIVDGR